jgi:hypothetical protein
MQDFRFSRWLLQYSTNTTEIQKKVMLPSSGKKKTQVSSKYFTISSLLNKLHIFTLKMEALLAYEM